MRIGAYAALVVSLLSVASFCGAEELSSNDYVNPYAAGTSTWPGICQTGKMQSPIDLPAAPPASFTQNDPDLIPLVHEGDCFLRDPAPIMINENHKMQLELPNHELCTLRARDTLKKQTLKYKLLQVHFHTPSEHTFGGKYADFEIHLVHYASNPKNITAKNPLGITDYLVIGVVANAVPRPERPNWNGQAAVLDQLIQAVDPAAFAERHLDIHPDLPISSSIVDLLPANSSYYHYIGSLTTPDCSEGVVWYVMSDIFPMWSDTLAAYKKFLNNAERHSTDNKDNFTHNERPTQKLNGRKISFFRANQTTPAMIARHLVESEKLAAAYIAEHAGATTTATAHGCSGDPDLGGIAGLVGISVATFVLGAGVGVILDRLFLLRRRQQNEKRGNADEQGEELLGAATPTVTLNSLALSPKPSHGEDALALHRSSSNTMRSPSANRSRHPPPATTTGSACRTAMKNESRSGSSHQQQRPPNPSRSSDRAPQPPRQSLGNNVSAGTVFPSTNSAEILAPRPEILAPRHVRHSSSNSRSRRSASPSMLREAPLPPTASSRRPMKAPYTSQ